MKSIVQWNPAREMMDLLEDGFPWRPVYSARGIRMIYLPVNAYATEDEIVITAEVPGVNPEDIEIGFENDELSIRGEFPGYLENVNYTLVERLHGLFSRVLKLNVPVEADKIEATVENGILTLSLPKAEEVKPKKIAVSIKS